MKRKMILSLFILLTVCVITGCDKEKTEVSNNIEEKKTSNKTYECRYSKDDNAEGKRYLTKYTMELNDKNEAEVLTIITGFSNYGSETQGYKEYCDGLEKSYNNSKTLLDKYKDTVDMKIVCDEKNNYEAYAVKEYKVKKIKDLNEFSAVYKSIRPYIKSDGTFDLEAWKKYFDTDSLKAGNYTCNF